jgi:hypothetical protein
MLGDFTVEKQLKDSYQKLIQALSNENKYIPNHNDYVHSLKELEDTFISISRVDRSTLIIKFQNPSIKDFISSYLSSRDDLVQILIQNAIYLNQLFSNFSIDVDKHGNKIRLNKDNLDLVIDKMLYNFDKFTVDRISLTNNRIYHENASPIKKLYLIARFFQNHINQYREVRIFIDQKLQELMSVSTKINLEDQISLISLLKIMYKYYTGDVQKLIDWYLKSMTDFNDIKSLELLEECFPKEFELNNQYIIDQIAECVYSLMPSLNVNDNSKDELWGIYYDIEEIESKWHLNFEDLKDDIKTCIDDMEEDYDPADYELKASENTDIENEKVYIMEMFKTLLNR